MSINNGYFKQYQKAVLSSLPLHTLREAGNGQASPDGMKTLPTPYQPASLDTHIPVHPASPQYLPLQLVRRCKLKLKHLILQKIFFYHINPPSAAFRRQHITFH